MRKKNVPHAKTFLAVLISFMMFFGATSFANAALYDDFTSVGIDNSLWPTQYRNDPGSIFSQSGNGYLQVNASKPNTYGSLASERLFGLNEAVSMKFSNYSSTYNPQAGDLYSGYIGLLYGTASNYVRITRMTPYNRPGVNIFLADWRVNGQVQTINSALTTATEGYLGIYFDGTNVGVGYSTTNGDFNSFNGLLNVNPHFTDNGAKRLIVNAQNGSNGLTTAQIDNISYGPRPSPVPIPAAVWLLGTGLLGLAGLRRKMNKIKTICFKEVK